MKRILLTLAALSLAMGSGACASFHINTPPGFARLESNDDYDYRATNAEGVVVAVRSERNRPEGNLEFWSRAIDERLQSQGYAPDGEPRAVQNASGLQGMQFRYTRDYAGRPLRYQVTVFVRGSKVFVVEAGGDREVFDRAAPMIERALASLTT